MTIGGWIGFGIGSVIIFITALGISYLADELRSNNKHGRIISIIIAAIIIVLLFLGLRFYYNNTASGQRAYHTQESELHNGLDRIIKVYDVTGELIVEYEGHFDIEYDDDRIIFDDENGNRHIIYYSVSTVVIDEIGD